jgi:hypothetical protein
MRPYYEGNKGTAVYNSSFRLLGDWAFFLDD